MAYGKKITVKISGISYGRQSNLYFYYAGKTHGVKYHPAGYSKYQVKDSVQLFYGKKYDFFILATPTVATKPNWPQMIQLVIVVVLILLLYGFSKKYYKKY